MKALFVSGEASSDLHGSGLLRELLAGSTELEAFGIGGTHLHQAGLKRLFSASEISVLGFPTATELRRIKHIFKQVLARVDEEKPEFAVLMDLPEFNIRLAKQLKKRGVLVFYYLSPQIWAWRKYRVHQIKQWIDKMLVVFPFEEKFYQQHGVSATFVGHPYLEDVTFRSDFRAEDEVRSSPRIALLPGSRRSEIRNHVPLLKQVVAKLQAKYPKAEFRLPIAPTLDVAAVRSLWRGTAVECVSDPSAEATLRWADLALVASGTATLETAMIGTPFCLFYWVPTFQQFLYRVIVRWKGFLGMPNLLLGKEIVPEIIFKNATAENLVSALSRLIDQAPVRSTMISNFKKMRETLGEKGASARAAVEISRHLLPKV